MRFVKYRCLMLFATVVIMAQAFANQPAVAFYYGDNALDSRWTAYDIVVIDKANKTPIKDFQKNGTELYGYVSVGEFDTPSQLPPSLKSAILTTNKTWQSNVMDVTNKAWQRYLMQTRIAPYVKAGYAGIFLDTLDSYVLSNTDKQAQEKALSDFILSIKQTYPHLHIMINRGFSLLPTISTAIDAVVVESLFQGYDNSKKRYYKVNDAERMALLPILNTIKHTYRKPVIVIDYVSKNDTSKAIETANNIVNQGFIPWVSNPLLNQIGVSSVNPIPRTVDIFWSSGKKSASLYDSLSFHLSFPLQFMGFNPVFHDVVTEPIHLSSDSLGAIMWFEDDPHIHQNDIKQLIYKMITTKIPVVFMSHIPFIKDKAFMAKLGVHAMPGYVSKRQPIIFDKKNQYVGYELMPTISDMDFYPLTVDNANDWLSIHSGHFRAHPIATTPFGGIALTPYHLSTLSHGEAVWVVNPFQFLKEALTLPNMPVPDVTTVNGRRLWMAYIDGDAYVSKVPWLDDTFAGKVIYDEFIQHFPYPITVSLIEREFELNQGDTAYYQSLMSTAKAILSLPYVTAASHTYSHPLEWENVKEGYPAIQYVSYPNPEYRFSFEREVAGSKHFVAQFLPKNKKVDMMLWSGDGRVNQKTLAISKANNLLNINGGVGLYLENAKVLANLIPFGRKLGDNYQVFAPIANDYTYTDDWRAPFYKYERVIHTFKLTDKPIRYKPISIYYHFYAGVEQSARRALKKVYNWTLKQSITPVKVTDYANKVTNFETITLSKSLNNNQFIISHHPYLRTLRVPQSMGYPVIDFKNNVLGFDDLNQDRYIHLGRLNKTTLSFQSTSPNRLYLKNANANEVMIKQVHDKTYELIYKGEVPFQFELNNPTSCQVSDGETVLSPIVGQQYQLKDKHRGKLHIYCQ